jgi:hypothetical protein
MLTTIKRTFRNFKQGIKNFLYWTPIIWKDRNWDHYYVFEILKHKLKAQSKYIGSRNLHTTAKTDARNMMICVNLIQKIQDDFYSLEHFDYHKENHWWIPSEDRPGNSCLEIEDVWENFDEYFKKYPRVYQKVLKEGGLFKNDSKKHIAMNIGVINQQRAESLLFKILNENITSWWN